MHIKDDFGITENFTFGELYGNNPNNKPENEDQFLNLLFGTFSILQPIRNKFGSIYVSSGRRSLEYNRQIGSKDTSDHITGNAFDIFAKEFDCSVLFDWINKNIEYDKLIFERRGNTEWLHISFKRIGENRKLNYVSLEKNVYKAYNGQSLEKVV